MKSVLRKGLKRKIIFTLGFLLDVYQELSVRNYYQKLYSPLYERTTITETLSRMSTTGEIEKKLINNTPVFCISTKGLKLLDEIIPLKNLSDKPWDGLWRIVIFDIAQLKNLQRNAFRGKLKELGFVSLQKSVWVHPYSCHDEIVLLREFFGLSQKEVRLITADDIENDDFLRKIFNL